MSYTELDDNLAIYFPFCGKLSIYSDLEVNIIMLPVLPPFPHLHSKLGLPEDLTRAWHTGPSQEHSGISESLIPRAENLRKSLSNMINQNIANDSGRGCVHARVDVTRGDKEQK